MKISAICLLLLIPIVTYAQNYPGMNEEDMQKMMQQMKEMESCMKSVDQAKLKLLEKQAYKFEAEVKSLCASGKRKEAQEKAISFGKEMEKGQTMQIMRRCSEKMRGMMPKMPFMEQHKDRSGNHVCD